MCGIIGYIGNKQTAPLLLEGLKKLEYRGYDSAGLCIIGDDKLKVIKKKGNISALAKEVKLDQMSGTIGIAHTRWATHGEPSERNAHPHFSGDTSKVAVVHNGIIENHEALHQRLKDEGFEFHSDTDTEVIAHLITFYLKKEPDLFEAVSLSISDLQGAYAIAVMEETHPERIIVSRNGAPLILGLGENGNYAASDASAL